ncbi:MAG: helix-turn-helix domain-containing protein [Candidatus Thiodiazotropha sp.]
MTSLALLVEPGSTPSSITVTLDLFQIARRLAPDDPFDLTLFSSQGGLISLSEFVQIQTQLLPRQLTGFDAVILPGFFAEDTNELFEKQADQWQPAIQCLRKLPLTTHIAASCYGTFVLAETGLLDGRRATSTWWLRSVFEARYPKIKLNVDQALIDGDRLITAGAMTAHIDLSLHLLRRLKGDTLTRQVGSIMLIDEARSSQLPFMALQRRFADILIDKAISHMEAHMSDPLSSDNLAESLHISYRTLHRRFQAITGMPPQKYYQALRIERAKELLETTQKSIDQIALETGYVDTTSFRRLFARITSVSPTRYRQRFQNSKA